MTAREFAVLIAAAGVLPASQRAVCPTKPSASVPDTPAIGAPLVVGDVDVVVGAVVDGVDVASSDVGGVVVSVIVVADGGGGAATVVCGSEPPEWSPNASTVARITAAVTSTMMATTSPTCVGPKRVLRAGGGGSGAGVYGGG